MGRQRVIPRGVARDLGESVFRPPPPGEDYSPASRHRSSSLTAAGRLPPLAASQIGDAGVVDLRSRKRHGFGRPRGRRVHNPPACRGRGPERRSPVKRITPIRSLVLPPLTAPNACGGLAPTFASMTRPIANMLHSLARGRPPRRRVKVALAMIPAPHSRMYATAARRARPAAGGHGGQAWRAGDDRSAHGAPPGPAARQVASVRGGPGTTAGLAGDVDLRGVCGMASDAGRRRCGRRLNSRMVADVG